MTTATTPDTASDRFVIAAGISDEPPKPEEPKKLYYFEYGGNYVIGTTLLQETQKSFISVNNFGEARVHDKADKRAFLNKDEAHRRLFASAVAEVSRATHRMEEISKNMNQPEDKSGN